MQYSTDDQLVIRAQSGDSDALTELISTHRGPLLGYLRHHVRDDEFAEDLVQETLLRLVARIGSYVPPSNFRGWIYQIARNQMIDFFRREKRSPLARSVDLPDESADDDVNLGLMVSDTPRPDEIIEQQERAGWVQRAVASLPDAQRRTCDLHYREQLSLSQVASTMGSTLPATKGRLRLAKAAVVRYVE